MIALCTAGVEPMVDDSPMPFIPSGFNGLGVTVLYVSYDGSSAADGRGGASTVRPEWGVW